MVSKKDIGRLLKQGLTGWEAGLLLLEDAWLVSRHADGFLSPMDVNSLRAGVKTEKDVRDFNMLMQLYRATEYIERQAYIALLAATAELERAAGIGYLRLAPILAKNRLNRQPKIMTQKQFEEEKQAVIDRQRQRKLQELESLRDIIFERAGERSPGWSDKWDTDEVEEDEPTFIRSHYPEAWPQAIQDILELIQTDKLKAVLLSQEDISRLRHIDMQLSEQHSKTWGYPSGEIVELPKPQEIVKYFELLDESERAIREAFQRAKQDSKAWIIASLERYKDNTLKADEETRLLDAVFCLGEALYQTGLPEWKEKIETYHPGWYERDISESEVAIIQKPWSFRLDEKGYYVEPESFWPLAPYIPDGELTSLHSDVTAMAIDRIEELLAKRQALEEVSYYIGIALYEVLDLGIDTLLKPAIGRYNILAETVSLIRLDTQEAYSQFEHVRIEWEKLKPDKGELTEVRLWIANSLGEGWWKRVKDKRKKPRAIMDIPDALRRPETEPEQEAEDEQD